MSVVAQVRLSDKEWEGLRDAMQTLHIESTSAALREAIRLLYREARGEVIGAEIGAYYRGRPAPPPISDPEPTREELEAADREAATW